MRAFCTIITADFLPFAKVLLHSLQKQDPHIGLQVLMIDPSPADPQTKITCHPIEKITDSKQGKIAMEKYAHSDPDHFRWSLKPLFLQYLLEKGFTKVIFIDPDIYFVNRFDFLFEQLDHANILLSPHWSGIDPSVNEFGLYHVLRDGLFNGGFIGVNSKSIDALSWWTEACNFKMERNTALGLYVDQKYLDVLPVYFDNVEILKHKGCNLASWNVSTCKREIIDGKLLINREFEPVFIHFAKETIANIINQNDPYLISFLQEYSRLLKGENFDLEKRLNDLDFSKMNSKITQLKYALRLRTRLKRFLYNLSQKI